MRLRPLASQQLSRLIPPRQQRKLNQQKRRNRKKKSKNRSLLSSKDRLKRKSRSKQSKIPRPATRNTSTSSSPCKLSRVKELKRMSIRLKVICTLRPRCSESSERSTSSSLFPRCRQRDIRSYSASRTLRTSRISLNSRLRHQLRTRF